jgi:prenylcysteine oxidase/farnesylcysteine lyase
METSALMGMNVARLIVDDYLEILRDQVGDGDGSTQQVLSPDKKDAHVIEL